MATNPVMNNISRLSHVHLQRGRDREKERESGVVKRVENDPVHLLLILASSNRSITAAAGSRATFQALTSELQKPSALLIHSLSFPTPTHTFLVMPDTFQACIGKVSTFTTRSSVTTSLAVPTHKFPGSTDSHVDNKRKRQTRICTGPNSLQILCQP